MSPLTLLLLPHLISSSSPILRLHLPNTSRTEPPLSTSLPPPCSEPPLSLTQVTQYPPDQVSCFYPCCPQLLCSEPHLIPSHPTHPIPPHILSHPSHLFPSSPISYPIHPIPSHPSNPIPYPTPSILSHPTPCHLIPSCLIPSLVCSKPSPVSQRKRQSSHCSQEGPHNLGPSHS